MALPDFFKVEAGTAKSWKSTGGDYAITLDNTTTSGTARQGVKGDLGATWARRWIVLFTSGVAATATTGTTIDLYWAASPSSTAGTDNPGNTSGTDATWSNPSELVGQLLYIGSLSLSQTRSTNFQTVILEFYPPTRYGMPVVYNNSGQALNNTAASHEIRLIPAEELVQDTV